MPKKAKPIVKETEQEKFERARLLAKQEGKDVKVNKLEDLPHVAGELDVRDIPDGDKFQLLTRYLNDLCVYAKNSLIALNSLDVSIHVLGKALGIDIEEAVRKAQEQALEGVLKQKLVKSKEELN